MIQTNLAVLANSFGQFRTIVSNHASSYRHWRYS